MRVCVCLAGYQQGRPALPLWGKSGCGYFYINLGMLGTMLNSHLILLTTCGVRGQ